MQERGSWWRAQSEKTRGGVDYVLSRKEWVSLGNWGWVLSLGNWWNWLIIMESRIYPCGHYRLIKKVLSCGTQLESTME